MYGVGLQLSCFHIIPHTSEKNRRIDPLAFFSYLPDIIECLTDICSEFDFGGYARFEVLIFIDDKLLILFRNIVRQILLFRYKSQIVYKIF